MLGDLFGALVAFVALMAAMAFGIRAVDHSQSESACRVFGTVSGRETRFVDYTYWAWDCLTPAQDGKWISTTLLRDEVK